LFVIVLLYHTLITSLTTAPPALIGERRFGTILAQTIVEKRIFGTNLIDPL
jgi:hypothetical protein